MKTLRDMCYYSAMFLTGKFIWSFVEADYKAGCIIASIVIALLVIAYILARACSKNGK